MSNFRYYWSQAWRSFGRNGLTSLTSVITVLCCLFILGLFLVMSLNLSYIASQVQQQCEVQAFVEDGTSVAKQEQLVKQAATLPNVLMAERYTKEQILQEMKGTLDEYSSLLDGYDDDNPYRDSIKITLNDLSNANEIIDTVKAMDSVAEVSNKKDTMQTILDVTSAVKNVSLWIMILLSLVSIFIIANTIKLAVYARRKEIGVMKFVGATNWFIRWPFVFEGIIIGIVGGILAFGIVSWGYTAAIHFISPYEMNIVKLLPYNGIWWVLLSMLVGIGAIIGALGSALSIRKHLDV